MPTRLLRRLKRRLASTLGALPVSSERIGPPKGLAPALPRWVDAYNARARRVPAVYRRLHAATPVAPRLPVDVAGETHWKFRVRQSELAPETFVARLPEGRVWGRDGAVLTPDDRLVRETAREFGRTPEDNSVFAQLRLHPGRKIPGRVAVLATAGSDVYYHWMFDLLPRWHLLQLANLDAVADFVVVNHSRRPFQLESLAALGLSAERTLVPPDHWHFHVKADEIILPSLPDALDRVNAWSCAFLRQLFLGPDTPAGGTRRLFISRRRAAARHLRNEAEVLAILEPLGFEVCVLEDMGIAAQAALFAAAECVVAPHGAGLTNLVFCRPGTRVIDLFAPTWVNPCYWTLSEVNGLAYHYLVGRGPQPPEHTDPRGKGDDIDVDPLLLRQTLRLAGLS